jgi:hypothetical protein
LAIQPYFDEQFLSARELKGRNAYDLVVARQLAQCFCITAPG